MQKITAKYVQGVLNRIQERNTVGEADFNRFKQLLALIDDEGYINFALIRTHIFSDYRNNREKQLNYLRQFRSRINKKFKQNHLNYEILDKSNKRSDDEHRFWTIEGDIADVKTIDKYQELARILVGHGVGNDNYDIAKYVQTFLVEREPWQLEERIIQIFISGALKDIALSSTLLSQLDARLNDLSQQYSIKFVVFRFEQFYVPAGSRVHYAFLNGGSRFDPRLRAELLRSDICLQLLSDNFIKSKYILETETPLSVFFTSSISIKLKNCNIQQLDPKLQSLQIIEKKSIVDSQNRVYSFEELCKTNDAYYIDHICSEIEERVKNIVNSKLNKNTAFKEEMNLTEIMEVAHNLADKVYPMAGIKYLLPEKSEKEKPKKFEGWEHAKDFFSNAPNRWGDSYNPKDFVPHMAKKGKIYESLELDLQGNTDRVLADEHILNWVKEFVAMPTQSHNFLAILGEYGMGKTFLCRMVTQKMLDKPNSYGLTPFYLDLRSWKMDNKTETYRLDDLLAENIRLIEKSQEISVEEWIVWLRTNPNLIIFDGLDELTVNMNRSQSSKLIGEMLRLITPRSKNEVAKSAMIISCRTHYFKDVEDQINTFKLQNREGKELSKHPMLVLLPFDKSQIKDYVSKRLPADNRERALKAIDTVYNLEEITKRPVLLARFCDYFSRLDKKLIMGQEINSADIYLTMESEWLERDSVKHTFPPRIKSKLMQYLSLYLWKNKQKALVAEQLEEWLEDWIAEHPKAIPAEKDGQTALKQREILQEDLRTASFMVRSANDNEFRFAHSSIQEFFIAKCFLSMLNEWQEHYVQLLEVEDFSFETWDFVIQLLKTNYKQLYNLERINSTIAEVLSKPRSQEIRTLCMRFWQLLKDNSCAEPRVEQLNLSHSVFREWSFNHLNFAKADFTAADFSKSSFRHCVLNGANFTSAKLSFVSLRSSQLVGAVFNKADIKSLEAFNSHFTNSTFTGIQCYHSVLKDCIGAEPLANISEVTLIDSKQEEKTMQKFMQGSSGHKRNVNSVSISADGKYIVSGSSDNTLKLWDAQSYACLHTFRAHEETIWSVSISADGKYIVSGSDDKTLKLWDAQSYACLHTFRAHESWVRSVSISANGKYIVSGSSDNTLKLWDAQSYACLHTFRAHEGTILSVSISADGKYIVSGSSDNTLKLWDAESYACLHTFRAHEETILSVSISADGKYVVSGSSDNTLKLWDAESYACLHTFRAHEGWVSSVSISADGKYIVSGSSDNTLKLWDAESYACLHTFRAHEGWVSSVSISADGKYIVSGSSDNTLKLWDAESYACLHTFRAHEGTIWSVSISADGKYIVSGSSDNTLKLWDAQSYACLHTFREHDGLVSSVSISADGKYIVSGSEDNILKLWDAESYACLHTFREHEATIMSVSISADGKYIVSGSYDNTLKLWDAESYACLHTFRAHDDWVRSVSISADGKYIVSGSSDNTLKLWDAQSYACLHTFREHEATIRSVSISADGKYVVSGSLDNTLKLWDAESYACLHTFRAHESTIRSVSISANGKYIVSGSYDNTLKLWDAESYACLHTFRAHEGWVSSVSISADGKYIVSGSYDNTLKLWDAQNYALLKDARLNGSDSMYAIDYLNNRVIQYKNQHKLPMYRRPHGLDEHNRVRPIEYFYPQFINQEYEQE